MRVIHYALGFPPYRTGGLTKYCVDLMLTQKEKGYEVALLWPGRIKIINRKLKIIQEGYWNGIESFEMINPLPVALDEGIKDITTYTTKADTDSIYSFFKNEKPDIFHVHSLMGLYKEFIEVANAMGIRTVFTTHDYYGLCPKVTFFYNGRQCINALKCTECPQCNANALSVKKISVLQSPLYRKIKDNKLIKLVRKKHRQSFFGDNQVNENLSTNNRTAEEYVDLRNYYISILEKIDIIHFNSTVSEEVYLKYIQPQKYNVVSITHRDIADHIVTRKKRGQKITFGYLGPAKPYKGFNYMLEVMDDLWKERKDFELVIYTKTREKKPYLKFIQDGYTYDEMQRIFNSMDCLLVPSLWKETFGFIVLEASSYGVPVIVSENVGAKDILPKENTYIDLKEKLIQIIENGIEFTYTERLELLLDMRVHTDIVRERLYCE